MFFRSCQTSEARCEVTGETNFQASPQNLSLDCDWAILTDEYLVHMVLQRLVDFHPVLPFIQLHSWTVDLRSSSSANMCLLAANYLKLSLCGLQT